jgi:hypothetical protein
MKHALVMPSRLFPVVTEITLNPPKLLMVPFEVNIRQFMFEAGLIAGKVSAGILCTSVVHQRSSLA